jgi:plastocyanin/uncharacterized membrane protein YozB (DUF420 family)
MGSSGPTLNILLQIGMGLALLIGMFLAHVDRYRAHGICQASVVLLNLGAIALFMSPMFRKGALSELPALLGDPYYAVATAHAALGTVAELFALYILLNAGTHLLPRALRFENYRPFMRTALALWWVVIAFGVGTYWFWNVYDGATAAPSTPRPFVPPEAGADGTTPAGPNTFTVGVRNFEFDAKDLTIEAGDTVVWTIERGRHTITADAQDFDTPILTTGDFSFTFDQVGSFPHCEIHGGPGGQDMAGTITVTARTR